MEDDYDPNIEEEVFLLNDDPTEEEILDADFIVENISDNSDFSDKDLPIPNVNPDALTMEDETEIKYDNLLGDSAENTKFRIRNKSLHLTYPVHINPHEIISFINTMKNNMLMEYSIVQETSIDGHQHTHAFLVFADPFITKSPTKFDINNVHPNIRKVTTLSHRSNIIRYHKKQGTPTSNMEEYSSLTYVEKIHACKTFREVCNKFVKAPSHIFGLREIYKYKPSEPTKSTITSDQLYHWQKEVEQYIHLESSKAIWFYDKNIRSGKTSFAKYLRHTYNAFYYSLIDTDLAVDLARNSFNDEGTDLSIVIIDVPMSKANGSGTHLYHQIEMFLDGELPPTKQNVFTTSIDIKKVFIMAKYAPDSHAVSHDKIEVNRIGKFVNNAKKTDYRVITRYILEGNSDSSPDEELVFPNVNIKKFKNKIPFNGF